MEVFKKVVAHTVLAIHVLIVFVLVFQSRIEVPSLLQAIGRVHPLLLHLPIGLLVLTTIIVFVKRFFENPAFRELISFLLYLSALTASLSTLMGLILSMEGGYDDSTLMFHKWLGISLSFFCWILLNVKAQGMMLKPLLSISLVLLILAGHFGASLTHGDKFVVGPLQKEEVKFRTLTDSVTLFAAALEPILESKCYSCHNKEKAKGRLILTSLESIKKGGKKGVIWKPGDAEHSLLVHRLSLPAENKEHMPPKDKPQLATDEIDFVSRWIDAGADVKIKLRELPDTSTLRKLSAPIIQRYYPPIEKPKYQFEFASQQKIQELSLPSRTVFQISQKEPALHAEFYLSGSFQKKQLQELSVVKEQLVSLNLSKMPIEDEDLKIVAGFVNLEKLILNNTSIEGQGLKYLVQLDHLHLVSLSGTAVKAAALENLAANKNIQDVYLWNTGVSFDEIKSLSERYPAIRWEMGYQPDTNEKLRLSPPFLKNDGQVLGSDEPVMLKHNLPGAIIRYTINDQALDSINSPVYEHPVVMDGYGTVKAKAYKDGWLSSKQVEYVFFKKGINPSKAELTSQPDKRYPGEGARTFIDDKKGMPDFYRDPAWIGFREEPLEAYFYFENEIPKVKSITVSYAKNIGSMCMPPASLEVWGGSDAKHLTLLNKLIPQQPTAYVSTRIEGATVQFSPARFACYKIVGRPLSKLPEFRKEKKQKGWLMVDEVFFN